MDLERLHLGRTAWAAPEQGASLEWLETNGLGGWAYGTVPNMNTRFYHAVLAAAVSPPAGRLVLLARLEECLVADGRRYPLYTNAWAGGHVEADGLSRLHSFALSPFPTWTYVVGDIILEKRLFMRHGANTTVIRYRIWRGAGQGSGAGSVTLELTPLATCRTIHGVGFQNDWPFAQQHLGPALAAIEAYTGAPRLYLAADAGEYAPDGAWVKGLHYRYEHLRGEHLHEDLYRPGRFTWISTGEGELTFVASTDPIDHIDGHAWEEAEVARRQRLITQAGAPDDPVVRNLVLAADQFVVKRATTGTSTVIAGYPWFTDWGRDTMIALPGLTLATGRYQLARELLHTFAAYERDGLIPNCFPEQGGEPLYNTADASLWFFEAVQQYLKHTGDHPFVRDELYPVLLRIAEAHVRGTHFDIRLMPDGLLRCGNPGVQVTWMDAKVDDWVVTPRDGKPVEIQALWHNALRVLTELTQRYGQASQAQLWSQMAERTAAAFAAFWNPAEGCLYDLLHDDGRPDPAIRPNQLFALTLSYPLMTGTRARSVVDVAFRELWTPYGLRSLSPRHPAYTGRYAGTRRERDAAYHQGTVWAWLIGPFIRAWLNAYGRTPQTRARARALLEPLTGHLQEFGLGTVAENFDGDPPYAPRACIAQAWSVAELLRLRREEC
jgi:predicted glycogen debranching enzyme